MVGNGKDIWFRWEDSPALNHCGFCERPLSHPGARTSCFGDHAEPCSRFHQAMFMRNKSHTCAMCGTADESHTKRHNAIADSLRAIYDTCGEEDWPIVPCDEPERGRIRTRAPEDDALDDNSHVEGLTRKKERKEQKRLDRAASRPRVVTLEDRIHIGLVLHATDRPDHAEGPNSTEEVAEIEKHLRYQAQIYTDGAKRCVLKEFSKIADADVDFESEMTRILDTLRIAELQKRNKGSRGLQGKSLKAFNTLVVEFKEMVVDDLLLLKKDELEIRMRRAAYLRYTNRASYEIVRTRYEERDWRTGEKKHLTKTTDTSQTSSRSPALSENDGDDEHEDNVAPNLVSNTDTFIKADTRHLHQIYAQKVGGEWITNSPAAPSVTSEIGGNSDSPLSLDSTPSKSSLPIPILSIKMPNRRESLPTSGKGLQCVGKKQNEPPVVPQITSVSPCADEIVPVSKRVVPETSTGPPGLSTPSIPLLPSSSTPWATRPFKNLTQQDKSQPTENLSPAHTHESKNHKKHAPAAAAPKPEPSPLVETPAVNETKKKKKKKREIERKARRAQEQSLVWSSTGTEDEPRTSELEATCLASPDLVTGDTDITSLRNSSNKVAGKAQIEHSSVSPAPAFGPFESRKYALKAPLKQIVSTEATEVWPETPTQRAISSSSPVTFVEPEAITIIEVTDTGRFDDWKQYKNDLRVDGCCDQVCMPSELCVFEVTQTVDCPFHDHNNYCNCCDPTREVCYIVYPGKINCTAGPFTRARALKLLPFFNGRKSTKGRVMIIDSCVKDWVTASCVADVSAELTLSIPGPLQQELQEYALNRPKGRLMTQVDDYRELWHMNRQDKNPCVTPALFDAIQRYHEPIENPCFCYCEESVLTEEQFDHFKQCLVRCNHRHCRRSYFHRRCIDTAGMNRLGNLSKWYCFECQMLMKDDAARAIAEVENFVSKGKPLPGWRKFKMDLSTGLALDHSCFPPKIIAMDLTAGNMVSLLNLLVASHGAANMTR